jgi:hypothetical protein
MDAREKKAAELALKKARVAHLRWVERAEALVAGRELAKEQVPVLPTACEFGQWYHGEGKQLIILGSYQAIKLPHEMLHSIYAQIFELLFGKDTRSTLSKLFGSRKQLCAQQREEAEKLLVKLKGQSSILLEAIDRLLADIEEM